MPSDKATQPADPIEVSTKLFIGTIFPPTERDPGERVCLTLPGGDDTWANFPCSDRWITRVQRGDKPWYVGVSTFQPPNAEGWFPRDREHAVAAWVIMCDDVGTKCAEPPVRPTTIVATSKGNTQWDYALNPFPLDTPEAVAYYEGCQKALADAGYSDPGARGVYRVMRLPGSLHRTGYVAHVTEWNPERVWDLPDLMAELGLEPAKLRVQKTKTGAGEGVSIDQVNDPVLDWLSESKVTTGVVGPKFVEVLCPWREEHTTGDGTAGYTPRGYGPAQFDHAFSCLHEHCTGRGKKAFLQWVAEQGGPSGRDPEPEREQLTRELLPDCDWGDKGPSKAQLPTVTNFEAVADSMNIEVSFNAAAGLEVFPDGRGFEQHLLEYVSELSRLGIAHDARARAFLEQRARQNPFSPFEEWLKALPEWDGEDHLRQLQETVTTPTGMWPVYLRKWLAQAVYAARAWRREPMSLPHVLVLAGAQGVGKSHWFSQLVPSQFFAGEAELHLNSSQSKDQQLQVLRKTIVELGEIDTTFRKSEIGALKAFLSRPEDELRRAYARRADAVPRSTIFCGTVNDQQFLHDSTGNRRFWPVEVARIHWGAEVDMVQVWAQVVAQVDSGGLAPTLTAEESVQQREEAEHFRQLSVVEVAFHKYFDDDWVKAHTEQDLLPVQADELLQVMDLTPSERRFPPHRGDASRLLTQMFGNSRTVRTKRRCWMVPVKTPDRAHVDLPKSWLSETE